jgi:hypothetical protein
MRHTLECLMDCAEPPWNALVGHASTQGDATHGVAAQAERRAPATVVFRYVLRAEISRVRIPPVQSAARAEGLWRHTCFEAFISAPGTAGYYEFNFAPSRQWALYHFDAYREGMSPADVEPPPELCVRRFEDRLELDAAVHLNDLIGLRGAPRLLLGLTAVVEEENGRLSYWALKHPPGKPDFHSRDGFVLELGDV